MDILKKQRGYIMARFEDGEEREMHPDYWSKKDGQYYALRLNKQGATALWPVERIG